MFKFNHLSILWHSVNVWWNRDVGLEAFISWLIDHKVEKTRHKGWLSGVWTSDEYNYWVWNKKLWAEDRVPESSKHLHVPKSLHDIHYFSKPRYSKAWYHNIMCICTKRMYKMTKTETRTCTPRMVMTYCLHSSQNIHSSSCKLLLLPQCSYWTMRVFCHGMYCGLLLTWAVSNPSIQIYVLTVLMGLG